MKKLIYSIFALIAIFATGCSDSYDDTALSNRVDNLEKRVSSLEELCKQLNSNVNALQTIVNSLDGGDYITNVTSLYEGDTHIGYKIDFAKSPSITIYHGKDGEQGVAGSNGTDGTTPVVGIALDTDGHYYWTLNGEWLTDNNGNKVSAEGLVGKDGQNGADGKDGANGITPQFKIENGGWYISLDGGQTWDYLGSATGSDGNNGTSLFSEVDTSYPDYVIFKLADGTEFKVPRHTSLSISFDSDDLLKMQPNATREIAYTISGGNGNLNVEVLSSGNVRAKISSKTSATGTLTITTGNAIDEYDKVVLLVSDGHATIMRSLTFEEAGLRVTSGLTYDVSANGATIQITVETSTDFSVVIPSEAQSWISNVASRAFRTETVSLQIQQNTGAARSAEVKLNDTDNQTLAVISINQNGTVSTDIPDDMTIAFPDENFRNYVLAYFDRDKDGKISLNEAYIPTSMNLSSKNIKSLEGIQYFTELNYLYCDHNQLESLDVSNNSKLEWLICDYNSISNLNISGCFKLLSLSCTHNQLSSIDISNNKALTVLSCSYNQILDLDISNNLSLHTLYLSNNQLKHIDVKNNTFLKDIRCEYNQLPDIDVSHNEALEILSISYNQLTNLDVTHNAKLGSLEFAHNQLETIDLSHNPELYDLRCFNNLLTSLDLNNNTQISYLDCEDNQLKELDVSKTKISGGTSSLTYLHCRMETLKTLKVRNGQSIYGITTYRSDRNIHPNTEIVFVD